MHADPQHANVLVPGRDARRLPQARVVTGLLVFDSARMTRLSERPKIWPASLST